MDLTEFLARLEKARYFEGYSEAAIAKAIRAVRREYSAGLKGPHKQLFERFPGLALVVLGIDHEVIGLSDLKVILKQFAKASFGMFTPQSIKASWEDESNRCRFQFTVNGTKHSLIFEDISWIPMDFFTELHETTRAECSGLEFEVIEYPDSGQSGYYVWCTPRALKAITRAGLVPSEKHPLSGDPPPAPREKTPPAPKAEELPALPLPKDPLRAERMGIFRRGKWLALFFSKKRLLVWREIADLPSTARVGWPLTQQIRDNFDLLCACHCGLTGVGDAAAYARQTVALVERYFFGDWREGHVEDGQTLTEVTARKILDWSTALPRGCAAAVFLQDYDRLRRILEYPRFDILDENVEHDLAYYRLLSDYVLRQSEWDWTEQTGIIEKRGDDRYLKLVRCLRGLQADDEEAFRKAIMKFATKLKFTPPHAYDGVVDADVTVLVSLTQGKGWKCDDFPERLQDRVLRQGSVD